MRGENAHGQNLIQVKAHTTEGGKRGWQWTCAAHPRARGFHQYNRWSDWWRQEHGKPVDHPWDRCITGAVKHYHLEHDPRWRW